MGAQRKVKKVTHFRLWGVFVGWGERKTDVAVLVFETTIII